MSDVKLLGKEEKRQSSAPGFNSVGQILKYYRELKGLSLEEISLKTHIKTKYLYSLEESLNDVMPAPVYVYSYIKHYAKMLGLEGSELVKLYQKEFGLPENRLPNESDDSINQDSIKNDNINKTITDLNNQNINNGNGNNSMDVDSLFETMSAQKADNSPFPLNAALKPQQDMVTQQQQPLHHQVNTNTNEVALPVVQQRREEPEPVITQEIIEASAQAERILLNARREADKIIKDAREQAKQLKLGAEGYAVGLLQSMEEELLGALSEVKNGRQYLKNQRK